MSLHRPAVEKWLKRNSKFMFYLVRTETRETPREEVTIYYLLWKDRDKIKYGSVWDSMDVRYGINTTAWLKGTTFWEQNPLYAPLDDVTKMYMKFLQVGDLHGEIVEFDLRTIKGLK